VSCRQGGGLDGKNVGWEGGKVTGEALYQPSYVELNAGDKKAARGSKRHQRKLLFDYLGREKEGKSKSFLLGG